MSARKRQLMQSAAADDHHMTSNRKQLVVELEGNRETVCKIVGTRESLLLLAGDLSKAAEELPEHMTESRRLPLPGWGQQTLEIWEDGVVFQAEPDLAAYLERCRAARSRVLPWLRGVIGVILVALALIGLRALLLWRF